ncbi:ribosome maturation factor RimM [Caulobacter sp. S45]|uniref:ribosome maturation factor RimM n=1 Tax=Caulobacter sp. S45 TaxID=1641861 RepID=UPI00157645A5|nr:ribosome maturation factor RimM [Caulobacter sp. S45]
MKPILVGRVAGAFGVRGELRITAYTEDPLALLRYRALTREDGSAVLTLQTARAVKGAVIGRAAEVASKEAADALRGLRLYVPREALPPPEEDEFYLADLIGLEAATLEGAPLGRVKAVHNFGAGDVLELDPGRGGPTRLVPFTRDVVPEVKLAERRIVVVPPLEVGEREPDVEQSPQPE